MKELSIEEKAKAYDNVRKKIAIRFGSNVADEIFSQFEMSEDERIRKGLMHLLSEKIKLESTYLEYGISKKDIFAWLEKQGEQKPAWSEEDEQKLIYIINSINESAYCPERKELVKSWVRTLKDKVVPQKQWKPSEEQMGALSNALSLAKNCGEESAFDLRTLHEQLKKLREE